MHVPWPIRPRADLMMLQVEAQRAGWAWACPYSSSDEFEAAVISARRRAGCYGSGRARSLSLVAVGMAVVTLSVYFLA